MEGWGGKDGWKIARFKIAKKQLIINDIARKGMIFCSYLEQTNNVTTVTDLFQ